MSVFVIQESNFYILKFCIFNFLKEGSNYNTTHPAHDSLKFLNSINPSALAS